MATEIARFDVPCTGTHDGVFETQAEQWVDADRILVTISQKDPNTAKVEMILLDKGDILRLADQLRGH